MPCISFNGVTGDIKLSEYATGRGKTWTGRPIYMIPCTCGYPLKSMFPGEAPAILKDCEFQSYNHDESCDVHQAKHGEEGKKKTVAWSITIKGSTCPNCHASIAIGPNILIAVEKFIRIHLLDSKYRYSSNKVKVSPRAKLALEKLVKFKSVKFMRESVAQRPDYAIVWRTGSEKHNYATEKFDTWYERRKLEVDALRTACGLDGDEQDQEVEAFDFSDNVMDAHGEDCTCNLCMK